LENGKTKISTYASSKKGIIFFKKKPHSLLWRENKSGEKENSNWITTSWHIFCWHFMKKFCEKIIEKRGGMLPHIGLSTFFPLQTLVPSKSLSQNHHGSENGSTISWKTKGHTPTKKGGATPAVRLAPPLRSALFHLCVTFCPLGGGSKKGSTNKKSTVL